MNTVTKRCERSDPPGDVIAPVVRTSSALLLVFPGTAEDWRRAIRAHCKPMPIGQPKQSTKRRQIQHPEDMHVADIRRRYLR